MARRKGFFATETRLEDTQARERDLAALVAARRTVVQEIGVERIEPNPVQARQAFTDLEELAQAIRAHGFTTRLRVRPHPTQVNTFQLVYGERRLRAARLAGLPTVPCEIADHSDDDLIEIGLAENIQRRDLEPLEEAQAFLTFIEQRGYSVRRLAEQIGKDKSYVESRLALLRMPTDVQQMVAQRPDTLRSAREIAKVVAPEERQTLISGVVAGALTTADVREVVCAITEPTTSTKKDSVSVARDSGRSIARDLQTVRAILGRWTHLIEQGSDERTSVATAMDELSTEVTRVMQILLAPPTSS